MYSFCMFSIADFPAGNVRVTVYSNGVPLSKTQLQYYTNMEEITCLLARAADPVDFMCQVKPSKGSFTYPHFSYTYLSVMVKWEIPRFLHIKVSLPVMRSSTQPVWLERSFVKSEKLTLMKSSSFGLGHKTTHLNAE